MVPGSLVLATSVYEAIADAARAAWPLEMVGLLGGQPGELPGGQLGELLGGHRDRANLRVQHFAPLPDATCTRDRFVVPAAMFATAEAELRRTGSRWLGFVHSHPDGDAAPSATDRAELWRECLQLIVAVDGTGIVQLAAFWPADGGFVAVPCTGTTALAER